LFHRKENNIEYEIQLSLMHSRTRKILIKQCWNTWIFNVTEGKYFLALFNALYIMIAFEQWDCVSNKLTSRTMKYVN